MKTEFQNSQFEEPAIQNPFWWLEGSSLSKFEQDGKVAIRVEGNKDLEFLHGADPLRPSGIQDFWTKLEAARRDCGPENTKCFICVRGKNESGCVNLDRENFLFVSDDLETVIGLAAEKLEAWSGALTQYAPDWVKNPLRKLVLRRFATGELNSYLKNLVNKTDWSATRIIDSEAWQTLRTNFFGDSGLGAVLSEGKQFILPDSESQLKDCLLAFRHLRLSFYPGESLFLAFSAKQYDYQDAEVERLLCKSNLLATDHIVQRLCTFRSPLFERILDYNEDREVQTTCSKAGGHVIDSLRNYTCEVRGWQAKQIEFPPFLKQLNQEVEPEELAALSDLHEDERARIDSLIDLRATRCDFHDFVRLLLEMRKVEPSGSELEMVATFNFSLHKEIACAQLKALPEAKGITYPRIEVSKLVPILLQKGIAQDEDNEPTEKGASLLHRNFSRHVVLYANVEIFEFPYRSRNGGTVKFGLAAWNHNLTELEAREAMSLLAHRRLPLHERRVLQLLQIPCRESLDDMEALSLGRVIKEKEAADLPPLLTAESCDEALLKSIDSVRDLRRELKGARSQKDVEAILRKLTFGEGGDFPSDSAIPTIEVLARIAEFSHVESSELREWMTTRRNAFHRGGNYLLDLLIEWVQSLVQEGVSESGKDFFASKLRMKLWNEFQTIFPDNSDWIGFKKVAEGARQGVSLFAQTVLNSVFQRPFLMKYKEPPVLPKREMELALQSVQRIHRLAAVFPVCCGDWTTAYYFNDFSKMMKYAESRVFASIKPGWSRQQQNGEMIMADECLLVDSSQCFGSQCIHAPNHKSSLRLLLWKVAEKTGQTENFVKTVERCGFWINTIIDDGAHHHFRCKCGELFVPEPTKAEAYYFSCPKWSPESNGLHDKDIYINWCLGNGEPCGAVIDSRDGKKCSKGKVICSKCGACCSEHKRSSIK